MRAWLILGALAAMSVTLAIVAWTHLISPVVPVVFGPGSAVPRIIGRDRDFVVYYPAKINSPVSCLVFGQNTLTMADGTMTRIPFGRSVRDGLIVYSVRIPKNAALGKATFVAKELYECGALAAVESPPVILTVLP